MVYYTLNKSKLWEEYHSIDNRTPADKLFGDKDQSVIFIYSYIGFKEPLLLPAVGPLFFREGNTFATKTLRH